MWAFVRGLLFIGLQPDNDRFAIGKNLVVLRSGSDQ